MKKDKGYKEDMKALRKIQKLSNKYCIGRACSECIFSDDKPVRRCTLQITEETAIENICKKKKKENE